MDAVASVTELDALLAKAGKLGFMLHMFRTDRHGPEVLAGVFQRSGYADVFVFSSDEYAYRLPADADTDVFTPTHVFWWYGASPVWTLRALLTLPEPGRPDAPDTLIAAPSGLGIPGDRNAGPGAASRLIEIDCQRQPVRAAYTGSALWPAVAVLHVDGHA